MPYLRVKWYGNEITLIIQFCVRTQFLYLLHMTSLYAQNEKRNELRIEEAGEKEKDVDENKMQNEWRKCKRQLLSLCINHFNTCNVRPAMSSSSYTANNSTGWLMAATVF